MNKHTAFKLFLCGVIITISVLGQARSCRRHSSKNDLCLKSLLSSVSINEHHGDKKELPVANSSSSVQKSDGHVHTRFKCFLKSPAGIINPNIAGWSNAFTGLASVYSFLTTCNILRPDYYAFVFRYTPF